MQETENQKEVSYSNGVTQSMPIKEPGMLETRPSRRVSRTTVVSDVRPILVSEKQFETVREEHLNSMDLLNLSGNALLRALEGMIPPADSGRVVGEYTAQGMRQLSKSICDIVQTKNGLVRSMYTIARDEI